MLMSDAWVNAGGDSNCKVNLEVEMINEDYLNYLNENVFPHIGTTVGLLRTAESNAEDAKTRDGFLGSGNVENYSDTYSWRTVGHPELKQYRGWYNGEDKVWPEDIQMDPVTLKHLYVGDGSFHQRDEYMKITTRNEMNNKEKVLGIFDRSGISINNFRYDDYSDKVDIFFSKGESFRLFELMGEPLPGFEYKWPEEYR
jgi:hypothetical protein